MHTIASAALAIRERTLTPVELLERCLERVHQLEDRIRAWVFVDKERARADAVRLTDELKKGIDRGPLHGIPIGVKDLFDVFDWPTAAGSKRWANSYARQDCPAVARLREAGAVFMGKTVTVAYAAFDPPITRNPWNPNRTVGGSSSGSAAAVACGMCLGALGSQTGGSITRPASYCGVYGLKPTHGRVNLEGVVPFAPSLDHAGVIAGSVQDLAIMLQPLARSDDECPSPYDYSAQLGGTGVLKKLGVPGGFFNEQAEPVMQSALRNLSTRLREKGWLVEPLPLPPSTAEIPKHHRVLMASEAAAYHGDRLKRYPEDYPPRMTELLREGLAVTGQEVVAMNSHRKAIREEMDHRFPDGYMYLTPATLGPPPDTSTTGSNLFQAPWSYLGLPTVSLPIAFTDDGLPLCVQIAARKWCEDDLLALTFALEKDIAFERREVPS